ncbi:MAG: hypothetical protein SFW35_09235 [Chitinophagales bacterium]|nr:hypothetical protein [Chitinophagales bacterium]
MAASRLEQLKKMLSDNPDDAFLQYAMAKELEKAGFTNEAIEALEFLIKSQPDYVATYYQLVKLYVRDQQIDKALSILDIGLERASSLGKAHEAAELRALRDDLMDD